MTIIENEIIFRVSAVTPTDKANVHTPKTAIGDSAPMIAPFIVRFIALRPLPIESRRA